MFLSSLLPCAVLLTMIKIYAKDRLDKDEISNHYTATGGDFGNEWVKASIEDDSLFTCFGFRVQYDIPAELTVDGVERKEHRFIFYHWDSKFNKLSDLEGVELKATHKAMIEAGLINEEDLTNGK